MEPGAAVPVHCPNGEINTIRGNRLWIKTRESVLKAPNLGSISENISPIIQPGMSDSASFDNVLEFFTRAGMEIPHALSMLIPESYREGNPLRQDLKNFYEYHSIFMEPVGRPCHDSFLGRALCRRNAGPQRTETLQVFHNKERFACNGF